LTFRTKQCSTSQGCTTPGSTTPLRRSSSHSKQSLVALSIQDREQILRTLDDPPEALAELRGVLLSEHKWRSREGLI